jgi:hypothetical protein
MFTHPEVQSHNIVRYLSLATTKQNAYCADDLGSIQTYWTTLLACSRLRAKVEVFPRYRVLGECVAVREGLEQKKVSMSQHACLGFAHMDESSLAFEDSANLADRK